MKNELQKTLESVALVEVTEARDQYLYWSDLEKAIKASACLSVSQKDVIKAALDKRILNIYSDLKEETQEDVTLLDDISVEQICYLAQELKLTLEIRKTYN